MDSPSLELPRPRDVLSNRTRDADVILPSTAGDVVLVAGLGDSIAADFGAFVVQRSKRDAVVLADDDVRRLGNEPAAWDELGRAESLIVFVGARPTAQRRRELAELLQVARRQPLKLIGVVSTFRVHLDDPEAAEIENEIISLLRETSARVVVFRPGLVLSRNSGVDKFLQRFAPLYPLIPGRISSCFLEGDELFAAIEAERLEPTREPKQEGRAVGSVNRCQTLLGSNRSWREVLAERRAKSPIQAVMTAVCMLLSWLQVGRLIAVLVGLSSRFFPSPRVWDVRTLEPRSISELISLCHRRNLPYLKVVGYNNGVNHFGHRYPGKTIVSTVRCRRVALAGGQTLKAESGATVRRALDFLSTHGLELFVVPNYSYVSLGTAFFVPIHGSAVDYTTVADTIRRVVFYDPETDRIVAADRGEPAYDEHVYNPNSIAVVLRVYLITKPKSGYFVRHETWTNASADSILGALVDSSATNVEIRQASSTSDKITVSRYFKDAGDSASPALELPRDALGRLWDLLEENPLASYLMHAVGRHVVWHTELFLTFEEFGIFWRTHSKLPIRKIQLRFIRRDGLPHSPFRDEDRISADLFLFRRHKHAFQEYLKTTFTTLKTNPGKHSN